MATANSKIIEICNKQLILTEDNTAPEIGQRVGSVTIDIANQRKYVRVFGYVPALHDEKEVAEFEKTLIKACEDRDLILHLFGIDCPVEQIRGRWFNPAMRLRVKGWSVPRQVTPHHALAH